ncbi:flotillin family protein [Solicola sp. PLA-1-18]|uniref:flotillin family protein n=1 Tax=Solicola sp. PLA-1-18 TaxID=3380532 RepID=UPI003B7D0D41
MPGFVIPVAVGLGVVLVLVLLLKTVWRVAEPNEALIISGLGAHGDNGTRLDSLAFKIVVGRGTMVIPGFQTVRRLPLDIRSTGMEVDAVSNQSIPLKVRGVVAYKIGDDLSSIANAARRFLEQSAEEMQSTIHELFAGHLRAIVGGMTVEEMLHNREVLTANIRTSLADDLQKLGLVVDSLQIQEINDSSNYIANLGKPQAADVEAKARIAAAARNQDATAAEQAANANNAQAVRDSRIKQEGYQAEVDTAANEAAQAGPLAEARARREVVRAETETAELDAQRTDRTLDSTVRKPADAAAYQARVTAEGERDARIAAAQGQAQETTLGGAADAEAIKLRGQAEAAAIQAKGEAEAAGIKARAEALAVNSDAVVAQQMAENYPAIVTAAASSFEKVGTMVVLNGADGVEDMLGKAMTMGGAGFGLARQLMDSIGGARPETSATPAEQNGDEAPAPTA